MVNLYLEIFIEKIKSYPDLPEKEELDLFMQYRETDDEQEKDKIRDKIVRANLKFVVFVTIHWKSLSFYEDLLQSGFYGLLDSIDRFDPLFESSAGFRTFAFRRILRYVYETFDKLIPSDKRPEIPFSETSYKDISNLVGNRKKIKTLDKIAFNEIFDRFCKKILTRREELVLRLSYGIGVGKYSRKEIASVMSVSESLVSLLKGEALKKLREEQKKLGIFNDFLK